MKATLMRYRFQLLVAAAFVAGYLMAGILQPQPAQAKIDLGDILEGAVKIGGVKIIVDEFGDEVNDFINKFLDNNDATTNASTKVVTIITPIGNKHIGAAQIVGPKEAVDKVDAVAQLETSFMDKLFRIKVLVPIDGEDASHLERVPGVGVSAVLDIKL